VNIVVVDDEHDLAACIEGILCDEGYTVVTFADGRAALDYLSSNRPDLALIDVMMPVMTGLELLEALSAHEGLEGMPVVVMSAVEQRAAELGRLGSGRSVSFMRKPFTADRLLQAVKKAKAAA